MNNDVKFMLRTMNHDHCPDKNKHYCHICGQRIFCEEAVASNLQKEQHITTHKYINQYNGGEIMVKKGFRFKGKAKYIGIKAHVKTGKGGSVKKHSRKGKSVKQHHRKGATSHTRKVYRSRKQGSHPILFFENKTLDRPHYDYYYH